MAVSENVLQIIKVKTNYSFWNNHGDDWGSPILGHRYQQILSAKDSKDAMSAWLLEQGLYGLANLHRFLSCQ